MRVIHSSNYRSIRTDSPCVIITYRGNDPIFHILSFRYYRIKLSFVREKNIFIRSSNNLADEVFIFYISVNFLLDYHINLRFKQRGVI